MWLIFDLKLRKNIIPEKHFAVIWRILPPTNPYQNDNLFIFKFNSTNLSLMLKDPFLIDQIHRNWPVTGW